MDNERFLLLNELIGSAYKEKSYAQAKQLIQEYLDLANSFKSNWNYGNAIHQSYTYLGLIALKENRIEDAKENLISSGNVKTSPQLRTFGPNMLLAKKILELGETNVVLKYLDQCKRIWLFIFSFLKIRKWKAAIKKGKIPNFRANLLYNLKVHS